MAFWYSDIFWSRAATSLPALMIFMLPARRSYAVPESTLVEAQLSVSNLPPAFNYASLMQD
jgi:hypothetical protein